MAPCRHNADPHPGFRLVAKVVNTPTRSAPAGNDDDYPASAAPCARLGGNRSWGANPTPTLDNTDPRPGFCRVVGVVKTPTKEAPLGADDGRPNTCCTTHLHINGS